MNGPAVKPRYFLSAYIASPERELVFSARHDHSVALWRAHGGVIELVRIWEFERLSGQKHHGWPLFTPDRAKAFIGALLQEEGLDWPDIEYTWGTPGLPAYVELEPPENASDFTIHSLSHLFSGLLMDSRTFESSDIVALAIDGGPDRLLDKTTKDYSFVGALSRKGRITYVPVESPAVLYSVCKRLFKMEEGSLMALASACAFAIPFDTAAEVGKIEIYGGRDPLSWAGIPLIRQIDKAARQQFSEGRMDPRFSVEENIQSAVMKVVQEACEIIVGRNIRRICALGDIDPARAYLSLTGGYALNCPSNSRMVDEFGFKGLLTPPCPNDSGQALGLGLLGLFSIGLLPEAEFVLGSAYLGRPIRDLESAAEEFAPWIEEDSPFDPERFVEDVTAGLVAWVGGAAEVGPRALGHRSLLADPRSAAAKDALNEVKGRQWWRPVAPIVLAEHASKWFETDRESPFMLETAQIRADRARLLPAVAHLDGSARLQTLSRAADPALHDAIQAFEKATGVPVLCNTSLNDKGEPIVDTAAEALNFCVRKEIPVVYIEGRRLALGRGRGTNKQIPSDRRPRNTAAFAGQERDRDDLWASRLAEGLTPEMMYLAARTPELRGPGVPIRALSVGARMAMDRYEGFALTVAWFERIFGPGASFAAVSFLSGEIEDEGPL